MDVNVIIDDLPVNNAVDNPFMKKKPLHPDKRFHIFFSYTDVPRDKLWVKTVISKLETEYGYICCDHERDFLPGTKIMDNIKDGVKNSEKVVVVFSNDALESHYVLLEAEIAHKLCLQRRKNLLIPVLLDDCDVPEEFLLLTYIDARDGVEETTWWPRLLKSIESTGENSRSPYAREEKSVAADLTFAVNQLCWIETKYSYFRSSIEAVSQYVPGELRPEDMGIPGDLIQATFKDLLQSHSLVCRQKCCCFATICVAFWSLGLTVIFSFLLGFIITCAIHTPGVNEVGCITTVLSLFACLIGFPASCVIVCKKRYLKKYVARHLVKEESTGTTEHRDIQEKAETVDPNDDLLLSAIEEPPCNRVAHQSIPNSSAINVVMPEEAEYIVDMSDDEPLLSIQKTESIDDESKALNMLLSCTPEYLALAYANKLKNPKEDRHGIEFMCLCQYLEKADKDFRKKVKTMKFLSRTRNIEEDKMKLNT